MVNVGDKVRVVANSYDAPWITERPDFDGIYFKGQNGTVVEVKTERNAVIVALTDLPPDYASINGSTNWFFSNDEVEVVND